MEFNTKLVGVVRAIYIYIAEMPGVNLCQNTSYPQCFSWFSSESPSKCQASTL